jgi:3-oxoacyl-[acyl-carrier protein] reductase
VSDPRAGRVALVTGGGRGIGAAIARRLAADGAAVAVNYVAHAAAADATVAAITAAGGRALAIGFDVGDPEGVRGGVARVVDALGGLDILVNNAGITRDALVLRLKEEDWEAVLRTDLTGVFLCTKAAARVMLKAGGGRIVNVTSVVAEIGNAGQAAYAAAKAGVIGFTKAVARELAGRNITVNAVAPGLVATELSDGISDGRRDAYRLAIPLGRDADRAEIAGAVAYLTSPDAAYVTGHVLRVNGGLYM